MQDCDWLLRRSLQDWRGKGVTSCISLAVATQWTFCYDRFWRNAFVVPGNTYATVYCYNVTMEAPTPDTLQYFRPSHQFVVSFVTLMPLFPSYLFQLNISIKLPLYPSDVIVSFSYHMCKFMKLLSLLNYKTYTKSDNRQKSCPPLIVLPLYTEHTASP
jgi:hypothetical protein